MLEDVVDTLRAIEALNGDDTDAEEAGNDGEAAEEDEIAEDEDTSTPKVKLPSELTEAPTFEVWVDDYGPNGVACPIKSETLRYIGAVALSSLAEAEAAPRLWRASILRGLFIAMALHESESQSGSG